ncbi:MAG: hypothetical protein JRE23_07240 [Deltaproteobacteria bacterium]|nr:hypothetical protein [Deltaproteobacteria bacterium]
MKTRYLIIPVLMVVLSLSSGFAIAAEQEQSQVMEQKQEQMFGSQLMTPEERMEYHNKMRSLKAQEEREEFRLEHHKKMMERAKEKGVTLPETPPAGGRATCPKGRMGPRGSGMGAGGGGRR